MRLHVYLRQLLSETPAHKLKLCAAVKRGDWGALVTNIDDEVSFVVRHVLSVVCGVFSRSSLVFTHTAGRAYCSIGLDYHTRYVAVG